MTDYLEQVLKEKKIAFAIFDQDLILSKSSQNFNKVIQVDYVKQRTAIWELFPELIGNEESVDDILTSKQKRFQIEKINKYSASGKLHYYNLTLLPLAEKALPAPKLLCVIDDTTLETGLEQEIRQQKYEIELLKASLSSYGNYNNYGILGESPKIQDIKKLIEKISGIRNTTVLLQGDSGTGKNLVARVIHQSSMLPNSPFVEINCASIPPTLLESEIFGFEKGAFTSAVSDKKGLIEEANGGTLFLDEIGELTLSLQAKFLSFLETKTFRRLGSTQERKINIRLIAATNKDLKTAVENKEFRQDLFFRLNVVTLQLPLLKDLGSDIIIIAENFIRLYAYDFRKKIDGLTERARQKLLNYSWPGNVRELRNVIERAVIFANQDKIDADDILILEDKPTQPGQDYLPHIPDSGLSLSEVEKKLLLEALERAQGNQSKAARLLGLSLDTFRYRSKKYHIKI